MSTPFSITWENWQTIDKIRELAVAYHERLVAIPEAFRSTVSDIEIPEIGDDIQAASFFADMQSGIDQMATLYINHTIDHDNKTAPYIVQFTLSTFRSEAGLHASGWRRSTNGFTFEYGVMQAGDIIGDWIFDDLRKALSTLKWTYDNCTSVSSWNGTRSHNGDSSTTNCAALYSNHVSGNVSPTTPLGSIAVAGVTGYFNSYVASGKTHWQFISTITETLLQSNHELTDELAAEVDVYCRAEPLSGQVFSPFVYAALNGPQFKHWNSGFAKDAATTRPQVFMLDGLSTSFNPVLEGGVTCSWPINTYTSMYIQPSTVFLFCKWDFTNTD